MVAYSFYESDNRVRRYAETLVNRGYDVDAIVLRREGQPSFEVIRGVNVYRIQERVRDESGPFSYLRKLLTFFLRSAWVLTWRHRKARYDIIHVHSVPDFLVFVTIVPRLMGAKVILDIHDILPEFYASKFRVNDRSLTFRLLLLIEKLSAAFSNHVIIANHLWHVKLTQRSVQAEKCTAIINYPVPSIFSYRARTVAPNGDFVMCYPGTLNWHQGVDLAISALALLRDKAPNLKFLIIGEGPEREKLKTMIKEQNLGTASPWKHLSRSNRWQRGWPTSTSGWYLSARTRSATRHSAPRSWNSWRWACLSSYPKPASTSTISTKTWCSSSSPGAPRTWPPRSWNSCMTRPGGASCAHMG